MQIAAYLASVEYRPHPKSLYDLSSLKSLTRFRFQLAKKRSQYLVAMTNVLDVLDKRITEIIWDIDIAEKWHRTETINLRRLVAVLAHIWNL